ncbi:putative Zinc finger protein [Naja naja]|nr:putative Zinc finger protein [Naja naja]
MLSLGAMKDGVILPSEEDRKRIITQMKVRTTLKGDKSWIHHKSGSEEKQNSPLTPCTVPSSHREPQSPSVQKNLSPKGVFTKTIDKSSPSKTASNGMQKSVKSPSQTSPSSQGPKMSTEDYKKLSPTQEIPAIVAKKIDVPDDFGQRSRSQTVPASAWCNSRGKSTNGERRTSESPQNESRLTNTSVRTKSALEHKHEVSNGERKSKDPDSKAAEFYHHQPTTEKENTEVYPGMGYRASPHLDNNEGLDSKRYSSFATDSRISCPQNQYQNQRSDEDSDSMSYYPFRDTGNSIPKSHRVPFYKDFCDTESGRNLTDSEAKDLPGSFEQKNFSNYESDSSASGKGLLFVKESIKSMEMSSSPCYNSRSLVDLSELENPSYSGTSYLNNTSPKSAESATSQWEISWIKSSFIGILSTAISAMRSSFRQAKWFTINNDEVKSLRMLHQEEDVLLPKFQHLGAPPQSWLLVQKSFCPSFHDGTLDIHSFNLASH